MLDNKIIQKLEFDKLISSILEYMPYKVIKDKFVSQGFCSNKTELNKRHNILKDFISFLLKYSDHPVGQIKDISEIIKNISKGGVVSISSLLILMDNLRTQRNIKKFITSKEETFIEVEEFSSNIYDLSCVEKKLNSIIEDETNLKDTASSELLKIRKLIATKELKIKEKLNHIFNTKKEYLQDELITMRNDRYVLPVKSEHRKKIQGMIHDKSSTGSTLFIEPLELIELNNDIKSLIIKEQDEIKRIIKETCEYIYSYCDEIIASQEATNNIYMNLYIAKYSLNTNSHIAQTDEYIKLIDARHPFIDKNEVVPISLDFGQKDKVLIITGPNTGGKTVTLKTVGLLSLMHRYGLAIPAKSGSKIKFFESFYVDIGDEQSIEQSLSTFSSHMKNIIYILSNADKNSLVILDEIGAGTDPTEGSAIALAVLSRLKDYNSFVLSTSHYSQVKEYTLSNKGYVNASVEFDVENLKPTYRLIMGIPGKSNAIEIAKRLGLDEKTIELSRKMLVTNKNLEDVIEKLQMQVLDSNKKVEEADLKLKEAIELQEKFNIKFEKLKEKEDNIIQKAKEEARDIFKEKEREVKQILKELRCMKSSNVDYSKMEYLNKKFLNQKNKLSKNNKNKKLNIPKSLKIGDIVYSSKFDTTATVVTLPDIKGNFKASMGFMETILNIKSVELTNKKQEKKEVIKYNHIPKSTNRKLDIRGYDTESARVEVDRFLDMAAFSNLQDVEIIHGKGTGILRQYIVDYLKSHPHVKSQRFGGYYEGGNGVSIVEIR